MKILFGVVIFSYFHYTFLQVSIGNLKSIQSKVSAGDTDVVLKSPNNFAQGFASSPSYDESVLCQKYNDDGNQSVSLRIVAFISLPVEVLLYLLYSFCFIQTTTAGDVMHNACITPIPKSRTLPKRLALTCS